MVLTTMTSQFLLTIGGHIQYIFKAQSFLRDRIYTIESGSAKL